MLSRLWVWRCRLGLVLALALALGSGSGPGVRLRCVTGQYACLPCMPQFGSERSSKGGLKKG